MLVLLAAVVTGAWAQQQQPATYAVKMANATDAEAANWTIASGQSSVKGNVADGLTGLKENDAVTVSYTGRMKIKSETATTDVLLPTDLSKLTAAYEAQDGEILTGTTSPGDIDCRRCHSDAEECDYQFSEGFCDNLAKKHYLCTQKACEAAHAQPFKQA